MNRAFLRHTVAIGFFTGLAASTASATTVDSPNFDVEPIVIVWAFSDTDPDAGPQVMDFLVDTDGVVNDLIDGDGRTVIAGKLLPTSDSFFVMGSLRLTDVSDNSYEKITPSELASYQPFDPTTTEISHSRTDLDHSVGEQFFIRSAGFFVASNSGYNVSLDAQPVIETGDFSMSSLQVNLQPISTALYSGVRFGESSALPPSTYGLPTNGSTTPLNSVDGTDVIVANGGTATADGTIVEQSVFYRFNYSIGPRELDLSNGAGEVKVDVVYTIYVP